MASVSKRSWTHKGETKTKWVVRYVDQEGKRRLQTFTLKKDADRGRLKIETEIEGRVHMPASTAVTVAELAKEFLKYMKQRQLDGAVGRTYIESLDISIRKVIIPSLGARKVTELVPDDLGTIMRFMRGKGYAARTIGDRRRHLLLLEAWGVRRSFMKRRILHEACQDYPLVSAPAIVVPSKQDVFSLLRTADTMDVPRGQSRRHPHRKPRLTRLVRLMVNLAAFCGLRYGEICALKVDSVDFEKRVVRIRHSVTRFGEMKSPKTSAGCRDVPIPPHLALMLQKWIAEDYISPGHGMNLLGVLLTGEKGKTLSGKDWHNGRYGPWGGLLRRAKLEGASRFNFHALRHFAGSWWIDNGMPIPLVSKLLGHANINTTMKIYAYSLKTGDEEFHAIAVASEKLLADKSVRPVSATRMQQRLVTV